MNAEFFDRTDITVENCPEMKVRDVIRACLDAGIENASYEVKCLYKKIGGIKSSIIFGDEVSKSPELYYAIKRRLHREPFSYIMGDVGFYNECYITTPAVLVPRQDTEILVDYAVKNLRHGARFLDICTGSGCIAISVLNNTKETTALAIDISGDAIDVARKNRELNLGEGGESRLAFKEVDALTFECDEQFDAILSNPPYIDTDEIEELVKEISSNITKNRKSITELQNKQSEIKSGMLSEEIIESYENKIKSIQKTKEEILELEEKQLFLKQFDEDVKTLEEKREKSEVLKSYLENVLDEYQDCKDDVNKFSAIKEILDVELKLDEKRKRANELVDKIEIHKEIDKLRQEIAEYWELHEFANEYYELKDKFNRSQKRLKEVYLELETQEDNLHKLKDELGVCPICGKEF